MNDQLKINWTIDVEDQFQRLTRFWRRRITCNHVTEESACSLTILPSKNFRCVVCGLLIINKTGGF